MSTTDSIVRQQAAALLGEAAAGYRKLGMPKHAELSEAMVP